VRGTVPLSVDKQLRQGAVTTLKRLLVPARAQYPSRRLPDSPGRVLKHQVPIRTFTDWKDARPGFLEIDLVATVAATPQGFFLCRLCAVDIATAWIELEAVWGKYRDRVGGAVDRIRQRLPLPLLGLDTDNGSDFINRGLLGYCRRHAITFTRSRARKKNDSAHVERRTAPSCDRVYDSAQTPYQRLCAASASRPRAATPSRGSTRASTPLQLRRDLKAALERSWSLAAPRSTRPQGRPRHSTLPGTRSRRRSGDGLGSREF
jgi:hypothetical protein